MRISNIEHALTLHIRKLLRALFTDSQIRYISFILSLITCLIDANVSIFALFTASFTSHLGYSTVSINIIAGSMLVGLYLTLPVLGYLADAHGPVLLAVIGLLVSPGYYMALRIYEQRCGEWWMALAFFFIGMGTSSSYFCSLLTCARVFPDRKGLSISLPVSCYGLSGFLLAWVFTWDVFTDVNSGGLNVPLVFEVFSITYAVACVINWVSSVVVTIEKEVVFAQMYAEEAIDGYGTITEGEGDMGGDGDDGLFEAAMVKENVHSTKFQAFLKDPAMPLVLMGLLCMAGPLELFVSNMANIGATNAKELSMDVAVFAVASTIARLSMGVISDIFNSCGATVRLVQMASALAAAGYVALYQQLPATDFPVICAVLGVAYGAVFTMFPTLVATVWGVEIFGSTWGLFLAAPAIGSSALGVLYAQLYETGRQETAFAVLAATALAGCVCVQLAYRHWS
jgi:MFS family permease